MTSREECECADCYYDFNCAYQSIVKDDEPCPHFRSFDNQ